MQNPYVGALLQEWVAFGARRSRVQVGRDPGVHCWTDLGTRDGLASGSDFGAGRGAWDDLPPCEV